MQPGTSETVSDKWKLIYFVFLIHGIGVLMPWNMFINAKAYFTDYKLSENYTGEVSPYLSHFMQYLTFSSQIPNIIFNWLNIFVPLRGSLTLRIIWSIAIEIIVFLLTVILAMLDTSSWPDAFFYLTMICVVILNMANGVYQNTIFGMAAKLPPQYTVVVVLGNNISGTFTSIVDIISKKVTTNLKLAAVYYFITALFILIICFDTFLALPLNKFYQFYDYIDKKTQQQQAASGQQSKTKTSYLHILKKCWIQYYNVFLVFFVTICIFPAVQASVKPSDKNFFLQDDYTSITCFFTFNFFSMIGSLFPTWFQWPPKNLLWIFVTLRVLFIPLFLLCNYQVDGIERTMPVLLDNDWIYWMLAVLLALTNGHFSSLAMMYAPGMVEEAYAGTAGMFAAAFLITGIFLAICTTFLWPVIIAI